MRLIALILPLLLTACGTMDVNRAALDQHSQSLQAYVQTQTSRATACSTAATACRDDVCVVATTALCNVSGANSQMPSQPQLRYPSQDVLGVTSTIMQGLTGLGQVAATVYAIDRNADVAIKTQQSQDATLARIVESGDQTSIGIAGEFGGALGSGLELIGNLPPAIGGDQITVGGSVIGGDNAGGNIGDTAGRDQVGGNLGDSADNGGIINSGDFRQTSPGPITDSGNDNSVDDGDP